MLPSPPRMLSNPQQGTEKDRWGPHMPTQGVFTTHVMGKLTMVGFFSTKKLFLVKRLMQKMR